MGTQLPGSPVVHLDILGCRSSSFAAQLAFAMPKLNVGNLRGKRYDDIEIDLRTKRLRKLTIVPQVIFHFASPAAMRVGVVLVVLFGCARPVQPKIVPAPAKTHETSTIMEATGASLPRTRSELDYCGMVFATIKQAVAPYHDSRETLETPCVRRNVTANGVWYVEAVGFDPMPTLTCKSDPWLVQIGEMPPRAPADAIVLIGFSDQGDQQFSARVERSDWRKQPSRLSDYGCGSVSGTVRDEGGRWVAKLTPER